MAGAGAHITSTHSDDQPSIFDVLAQENLVSSLRPALKYILRILAEKNPVKFGWLYAFGDEVFMLLDLIVEDYYLRHYQASFAENFYGIKRVPMKYPNAEKLPSDCRLKSLSLIVLWPYLKGKLETLFERLRESAEQGRHHHLDPWKKKLYAAFLFIYPYLHFAYEGIMFACQIAYVFHKAQYHSPLLKLASVFLANLSDDDIEHQLGKEAPQLSKLLRDKSWIQRVLAVLKVIIGGTAIVLSNGLSVGVFFLQFLEWWYASEQRTVSLTSLPTPSPPNATNVDGLPKVQCICPLCKKIRTNDTTLMVSGYVFCYPCIYNYVRQNYCCPVTGYPANCDHLVKLYLEN